MNPSPVPLLAVALWAAASLAAQDQAVMFDGYIAGVRVAELTIRGSSYTIRKKHFATNRWSDAKTASVTAVAGDSAFSLWGALRDLPARIASIERVDWASLELVGWPDRSSIYERHRDLSASVGNRPATATRWAKRDATRPMDLVIGAGNR